VVDGTGKQIPASRNQQDFTVRLSFDQPLAKGKQVAITFFYDGKLSGRRIRGVRHQVRRHTPDFSYLMYPARWFPVSGYTTDALPPNSTSPCRGFHRAGSGNDSKEITGDKTRYQIKFERASFPGSIAIVKGCPRGWPRKRQHSLYFRGPETDMTQLYGEQIGKTVSYFTGVFGLRLTRT